jgi:CubicO group peptidase (beta-lactamase class C family)
MPSYQVFADEAREIDALFRDYSGTRSPGASVIVIKDGQVIFKKAYGWANIEDKVPATTQTNYDLGSVTKQFTAMAIMILAERKKLNYDDSITKFFPDFPAYGKAITVRHLLNHTSGLIDYKEITPPDTKTPLSDKDVLELLKKQNRTYFPPSSKYRYSNSGYDVLSLIVEKASGSSFPEFLKTNIFEPLRMSNTRFYAPDDFSDRNRSIGYDFKSNSFERAKPGLFAYILGDGCLYSSVEDLYKWDKALYTTRLVSTETLKQAFTPAILTDSLDTGYGFGWFVTKRNGLTDIWHSGGGFGSTTYIHRLPEKKLTVIVLTNRSSQGDLREITNQIVDLYLADDKTSAVRAELLRLHREYNEAMSRGDRKTLDRLIAEDFIRTQVDGANNKSEMQIESSSDDVSFTEDFLKVRLYENTAVITGRVNVQFKDETFRVRFTEVWHKRQKGWQIVSSQLTPMQTQ